MLLQKEFPIPKKINENSFIEKADQMLESNEKLKQMIDNFLTYLQSQYPIETFTKKIQNWHELEFGDFIKELDKATNKTGEKNSPNQTRWNGWNFLKRKKPKPKL